MAVAYRYHRFSSKSQDKGSSLERQQQATASLCHEMGWEIAETLEDLGRSAWKGDHLRAGSLGQFKARVDAGEIPVGSVLVVENVDRLSRENVKKARRWIEEVTEAGVRVAVCSPSPKVFDEASLSGDNNIDLLTYLLEAKRAREESDRKSVLLQGMWTRHLAGARDGRIFTARCPGWLRVVGTGSNRQFEPIPEHVGVVRQIYEWSADGFGAYAICDKLNKLGVKPWGKNFYKHPPTYWRHRYVRDVLLSPAVEGEYHPRSKGVPTGERIHNYYPRVVDADLVARARAGLMDRRGTGGTNRGEARNLFAGKVKCGHCGNNMIRTVQRQKFQYFICQGAQTRSGCTNRGYRYDYFEKAALAEILHLALDDRFFQQPDETKPLIAALADANKAIENKEAEQRRLLGFIMRNNDASEAEALLNSIRPEVVAMRKERDELQRALDKARGAVSHEEHRQRVLAVSNAIYADEPGVRDAARRKVRDAIASVVDRVVCEAKPDKRIQMSLAGGRVGYQLDNRGNILQSFNLYNRPDLQRGSKGIAEAAWQEIKRRGRAAEPKS
jgi:DNA invertase Pin-like site-specific DNA recombinase